MDIGIKQGFAPRLYGQPLGGDAVRMWLPQSMIECDPHKAGQGCDKGKENGPEASEAPTKQSSQAPSYLTKPHLWCLDFRHSFIWLLKPPWEVAVA